MAGLEIHFGSSGNPDDATSGAGTTTTANNPIDDQLLKHDPAKIEVKRSDDIRITSLQTLLVSSLSEIIGTTVNDDGSADDGLRADEGDDGVCPIHRIHISITARSPQSQPHRHCSERTSGRLTLNINLGNPIPIRLNVS